MSFGQHLQERISEILKIILQNCDEIWLNFEFGAVHKHVHLVDLVKSFQTSICFCAKFGVDTAENGPLKVGQKLAKR